MINNLKVYDLVLLSQKIFFLSTVSALLKPFHLVPRVHLVISTTLKNFQKQVFKKLLTVLKLSGI